MSPHTMLLFAFLVCGSALSAADHPLAQPVRVTSGLLAGSTTGDGAVTSFKGIPYAAPPVGDLRWRAPQPPLAWEGVRQATAFGQSCLQPVNAKRPPYTEEFSVIDELSEDCLFLNVWTPARTVTDALGVLVYLHGGSGTHGSGSVSVYDGEGLARKGILVVTINFRLGPFAGMGHPQLSAESPLRVCGNYGMLDMIAALTWVQHNIAAFGGDPRKVTVCGQSSGCMALHYLTTSPLATGLFRGAIAVSFGYDFLTKPHSVGNLWQKEQSGVTYARARGLKSLADLRALSGDDLLAEHATVERQVRAGIGAGITVDGWVFPHSYPDALDRGLVNDVPILTGFTKDDFGPPAEFLRTTVASFPTTVPKVLEHQVQDYLRLYPASTDDEARLQAKRAQLDYRAASVFFWAKRRAKTAKTPSYTYRFDQAIPWPAQPHFGAFHSSDLIYAFNNLGRMDRPWTDTDRRVAELVSSYWVNFVNSGNPNGDGLPIWKPFAADLPVTMSIGATPGPLIVADPARFAWYQALMDR